jgi:ribosomal protein S6E (S10)
MSKKSAPKRDFMQVARGIVEVAIGEQMDGAPLAPSATPTKKQIAGSKGGTKGGIARAQALTSAQKRQIAVKAAQARWKPKKAD